jgi:hypothetical protein
MEASEFVSNILPLGARKKPGGKIRMLVDPSLSRPAGSPSVNDSLMRLPCPLTSIERIAARVKPHSVLGK